MDFRFIVLFSLFSVFVATGFVGATGPSSTDWVRKDTKELDGKIKAEIKKKSCAAKACFNADKLEIMEDTIGSMTDKYANMIFAVRLKASEGSKITFYDFQLVEQPNGDPYVHKVAGPMEEKAKMTWDWR